MASGAQEDMLRQAATDELTGVRNRGGFFLLAEHQLSFIRRQGMEGALAYIDIDGLGRINEKFGESEGSAAVVDVAAAITVACRETDVIGRVGDDEFAVLLVNPQGQEDQIMRRLDAELLMRQANDEHEYPLSVSVGIVDSWAGDDLAQLLESAQAAMAREKRAKREMF